MKHRIGFLIFRITEITLGIMPYFLLYTLSNGFSFVVGRIIKYRKKVIDENLHLSFPSKSKHELGVIRSKFYLNLCDILLESFKGPFVSEKELKKRYIFNNSELIKNYSKAQEDILIVGSHYTNWEWGAYALGQVFDQHIIALYKPLKNPILDKHVKSTRASEGLDLKSIHETRYIFNNDQSSKPKIFVFLSDQSPSNLKEAIWMDFLNQKTACLHGVEKYARDYNLSVVFSDIRRVKRGHYEVDFIPVIDDPNTLDYGEITRKYMRLLEARINLEPHDWLWSHRRWKHKKK